MNDREQLSDVLTPRSSAMTLHSSSNPAVEQQACHGDQLRPLSRMAGGFVEVEFAGGQWFAVETALEPWTPGVSAASTMPSGPISFTPRRPAAPGQPVYRQDQHGYQQPNLPPQHSYQQPPYGGGYGVVTSRPCFNCGREWGVGRACQFCRSVMGLPVGVTVTSAGKRFGGYLLELLLIGFTFVLGWLIWSLIVFGKGQTPAKQLLGMRVIDVNSGRAVGWGTMFLREVICKTVIGLIPFAYLWLLWDKDQQELWDKMLNTVVVNDPNKTLAPMT
jgi:uncharacterized RDD family membrane protein YckC